MHGRKNIKKIKLAVAEQDWRCCNSVHTTTHWFQTCGPTTRGVPHFYCNESAVHMLRKHKLHVEPELKFKPLFFRQQLQSMKPAVAAPTTSLIKSL